MKKHKKFFPYVKYALIALLIIALGVQWASNQGKYPDRLYGNPVVSTKHKNIDIPIEQIAEDDQYLYVLHHHANGILQVYDLAGNYRYTWFFYCHTNGGFSMTQENDTLYVRDMRRNIYVFQNGVFQRFLTSNEADSQLKDIDFSTSSTPTNYQLRNGSVWRISDGVEECVVKATTTQLHPVLSMLSFAAFALCLIFLKYKKII